jgi:hypothetical protein
MQLSRRTLPRHCRAAAKRRDPAIQLFFRKKMDARVKPAHDGQ